jgi:hypothetical protein
VPVWVRRLENRTARKLVIDPRDPEPVALLREIERESPQEVVRLAGLKNQRVRLRVDDDHLEQLERLILLVTDGRPTEILEPFRVSLEEQAEGAKEISSSNSPDA